jgi:hypothetical protein
MDEPEGRASRVSPSNEVPAWAASFASAAFRSGRKATEIEAALLQKGLSPSVAQDAVDRGMEMRLLAEGKTERRAQTWHTISRAASLVVTAPLYVEAAIYGGFWGFMLVAVKLLLPMACIWFPAELSDLAGSWLWSAGVYRSTPTVFVAIGGWIVLAAYLFAVVWLLLTS